jgi:hypothetical protein
VDSAGFPLGLLRAAKCVFATAYVYKVYIMTLSKKPGNFFWNGLNSGPTLWIPQVFL